MHKKTAQTRRLEAFLAQTGKSAREVSLFMDYSESYFYKILQQSKTLSESVLFDLYNYFGLRPEYVLLGEEPMIDPHFTPAKAGKAIRNWPDKRRQVRLPLLAIRHQLSFLEDEPCSFTSLRANYPVSEHEGEQLTETTHVVLEIGSDQMVPLLRKKGLVLCQDIPREVWPTLTGGVFAVILEDQLLIYRLAMNRLSTESSFAFSSDNLRLAGMEVRADQVRCLWRVLRVLDQPVE